jgi:hypothetical protein
LEKVDGLRDGCTPDRYTVGMGYSTKEERKAWRLRTYAERRAAWFADKQCEFCGATEDLQLDHINPAEKSYRNAHNVWLWGKKKREAELAKCRALCRSCHVERHYVHRRTAKHGTAAMHSNGCRCRPCNDAKVAYNREYLRRTRASSGPPDGRSTASVPAAP